MVKKSFALAILICGTCALPSHAQGILQSITNTVNGINSAVNGSAGTAGMINGSAQSTQFDPSSFIPFQTTDNGGANQITGIYTDPNDPNGNAMNQGVRNGLPPTSMDSFVYEAGGLAELIYGDEGVDSIPPYFEFDQTHRINDGILGRRNTGLTTGHGSLLPNAWGGDEFVKTEPWTMSGANGGNPGMLGGLNINIPGLGNLNIGANGVGLNANQLGNQLGIGNLGVGVGQNGVTGGGNIGGVNIGGNSNTGVNVGGLNFGTGF